MRTNRRFDNDLARAMRLICVSCLIVFSTHSYSQELNGHSFWYEPAHDKWVATEFYKSPTFEAPLIHFKRKTRIHVLADRKGWLAIRIVAGPVNASPVFMPIRMFKSRLYKAGSAVEFGDARVAFARASLFEDDPDVLKRRFDSKDDESKEMPKAKPSAKLKPWQKYKENWGSVTPAPKKNKHSLLDDIKQPGVADATPAADAAPAADAKP